VKENCGEWCSELMRSIRHKPLLRTHSIAQSFQQIVDTRHQYPGFAWQVTLRDWGEVVLAAGFDLGSDIGERLEAVVHYDSSEQQRDPQQSDLRRRHADENLTRQSRAFDESFRHRNHDRVAGYGRRDQG